MENKEVVKERVRRFRERQKGGQPPRMGDVVPGVEYKEMVPVSPLVLEMIGRLEKRVAALEGRLVGFDRDIASLEEWRASVGDYPFRKDALAGKHTFKKDSPEDLFKRVVAEKAERLSIS